MSEDGRENMIEVFVSLADGDKRFPQNREAWDRLTDCLATLRGEGVIRDWFSSPIDGGLYDAAVIERLKRSDIIIFALGQNYLDLTDRYSEVLKNLPQSGRYLVFSLLLYPGDWYDSPFRKFNLLPSSKEAVTESSDIESAFTEIKEAIRQARLAIFPTPSKSRPLNENLVRVELPQPETSGWREIIEDSPMESPSPQPYDMFEGVIQEDVSNIYDAVVEEEDSSIIAIRPPSVAYSSEGIEPPIEYFSPPSPPPSFERREEPPIAPPSFGHLEDQRIEPPNFDPPEPIAPPSFESPEEPPIAPPIVSAPSSAATAPRDPEVENRGRRSAVHDSISPLNPRTLESERNRIVTDAARRSDIQPSDDAQKDVVDCTVFAPASASRGGNIFVQIYAHLSEQAEEASRMAGEFDSETKRRAVKSLEEVVARGTTLSFELNMPGLRCSEPTQSLVWRGSPDAAQFAVEIPGDCPLGDIIGSVIVSSQSIPIGHIRFKLRIVQAGSEATAAEAVGLEAKRYGLAYISYASADRSKVLARVQMLNLVGIRYFQDVLSLKPGDKWETEIYKNIDSCDLFLLFWSRAARDSVWVMKEVRYARNRPQPPEIRPVVLEGPPVVMPPEDLNDLHFNDRMTYFILDQRS